MASIAKNTAFGVVTVMDVRVFNLNTQLTIGSGTAQSIDALYKAKNTNLDDFNAALEALAYPAQDPAELPWECSLDHLTVATLSTDGPSITINGGKYNNPLIKYGKTARCEMTDALGQMDALVALGGAEYIDETTPSKGIVVTDKFSEPVCLVGRSFVVDQKTGKHVPVTVFMYQFLPDSVPSFSFDSGNAATFDLNGDLLAVEFASGAAEGACDTGSGTFFSIKFSDCTL